MFKRFISLFKSKPYVEPVFWAKKREAERLGIPCKVTEAEIREAMNDIGPTSPFYWRLNAMLQPVHYEVVKE